MSNSTRRLASVLAKPFSQPGHSNKLTLPRPTAIVRQGVVQAVDTPTGTATVLIGGATTPSDQIPYKGFPPGIGEVVNLHIVGDSPVIDSTHARPDWMGPWGAPWGMVPSGFAAPASITGFTATSATDLLNMIVQWNAVDNRLYKITAYANLLSTVDGDIAEMQLADAGGLFGPASRGVAGTTVKAFLEPWFVRTYPAGFVTAKAEGRRVSGTGTLTYGSPQLLVEDIGPATDTP